MLVRGADRLRARINVTPPPGSFTAAHLALYEEVRAAQTAVFSDGLGDANRMYRGTGELAHG